MTKTPSATKNRQDEVPVEDLLKRLVLTGADIVRIGEDAELLVGGKNYNTALISRVEGVRIPQFRAISSVAFHIVLDECKVCAALIRSMVDEAYNRIDWTSPEVTKDHEFLPKFVRSVAAEIRKASEADPELPRIRLRTFVNNVVDGFASSQEGIDQLRKRSVMVQAAILSCPLPERVDKAVRSAYRDICAEAQEGDVPVAVRSSAAGEDSRKKAFAGLQDTFLNMVGDDAVATAYLWDCASAYNLRSMIYRREAILDALTQSETTGQEELAAQAKKEWSIENTSLSVCIMRMINPVVSGTAFSADTATGCRGTVRKDLVSIDTSYGLGEAVVGGRVTPDKLYVYQKDDGSEVVIRFMGSKTMKIVYDENGGTKEVPVPERECMLWALTPTQAEQVAKGVRAVSKAYDGMIMDTEFCIDSKGMLWFVQARPETRWNEELALHPHTIFMRRREVEPKAAAAAEVLLTGNGASRGAGQGKVRFLRSALELNRVGKGEILAAERTDPDMVPGMRVASAILADVGGDTSHAAITSRELGIAAVIGIQNPTALQALDGLDVTVDGTRGRVYRGLLPLHEVGGEMDVEALPKTKTRVGLVLRTSDRPCSCPASATCRTLKWACCAPNSCSATWACTPPRWKPSTTAIWNASSRRRSANWTPSCARPSANSSMRASCRWISASANTSATSPASRKSWKSSAKRMTSATPTRSWPYIGVCVKSKSCWTNTPNAPRASTRRWKRPRIWPNTSASSWATKPNCWPSPAIPPK